MTASERIREARSAQTAETRKTMSPAERRELWLRLYRKERAKLVPNCGRLSGQQIAYAKGRVTRRFKELGL